jgi:tetratricopeptide (TPR) repeat protein
VSAALNAEVYFASGLASLGKLDYIKAIRDFTEAILLDPKISSAYDNRGDAYLRQRNFEKAMSDYTEALEPNLMYPVMETAIM